MEKAFEQLENCLIFLKSHESWYNIPDEEYERAIELCKTGLFKFLKQRDPEGRKIVITTCHKADPNKFNQNDIANLVFILFPLLAAEEETQICGINFICNTKNISLNYVQNAPIKMLCHTLMDAKIFPMFLKNIFIIGVPQFAIKITTMIKCFLSEKIRKRFHIVNDFSDIPDGIANCLSKDENEEGEDLLKWIEKYKTSRKRFFNFDLDLQKAEKAGKVFQNIGSFRMLQVD